MSRQAKQSFWSDFRTGLSGFATAEEMKAGEAVAAFALEVRGATEPFQHLNGRYVLHKPPGEGCQTWVTDDNKRGFYLMGSMWGWRLQQGDGPDFSSGWEQGPIATYAMRGLGPADGQTLTAEVSASD